MRYCPLSNWTYVNHLASTPPSTDRHNSNHYFFLEIKSPLFCEGACHKLPTIIPWRLAAQVIMPLFVRAFLATNIRLAVPNYGSSFLWRCRCTKATGSARSPPNVQSRMYYLGTCLSRKGSETSGSAANASSGKNAALAAAGFGKRSLTEGLQKLLKLTDSFTKLPIQQLNVTIC